MYIKLTRLDNTPIWINAAFVVTVEPRKLGGATVVPIGDGLDYDVRETADQVLSMLGEAPAATVVPVPVPKSMTPMPSDVSPEPEGDPAEAAKVDEEAPKPAKRTTRTRAKKEPAKAEDDAEPKPAKRTRRIKAVEKPVADFPDEQVERLKKMAPGSMRKLLNTLVSQFKVAEADADAIVALLHERGVVGIEQEHIIWK